MAGTLVPINTGVYDVGRKVQMFHIDDIESGPRLRPIDGEAVERLAASINEIGLRTPISVRYYAERPDFLPGKNGDALLLLTGAHRLAAAKRLGWETIECIVYFEGDEIDAQLWEIAENLHRADLTKAQRDEHIRRYAKLLSARETAASNCGTSLVDGRKAGPQHQPGIAKKIATETGLSKSTVERALNPERAEAEKVRREEKAKEQAEFTRQRDEHREALSPEIKEMQARRTEAMAGRRPANDAAQQAEIDELREANIALEEENATLKADVAKFEEMRVLYEQGGFNKIIAAKDEEIRVLETRVAAESRDKVVYLNKMEFWKAEAIKRGWTKDVVIDMETGEVIDG